MRSSELPHVHDDTETATREGAGVEVEARGIARDYVIIVPQPPGDVRELHMTWKIHTFLCISLLSAIVS